MSTIWQGIRQHPDIWQRQRYGQSFPNIGSFWVLDGPSQDYNCLGYAVYGTKIDYWPWHPTHRVTAAEAIAKLTHHGFTPCSRLPVRSTLPACNPADTIVAYSAGPVGIVHFARYSGVSPWWNGKMNYDELIAHHVGALDPPFAVEFYAHRTQKGGGTVEVEKFTPLDLEHYQAPQSSALAQRFEEAYADWVDAVKRPPSLVAGMHPSFYVENDPYERMMALGVAALPHFIEKIAAGVRIFNWAVEDLVGIHPPVEVRQQGEQAVSHWWLTWWDAHRDQFQGG